jgi:hypothetical protein
VHYELKTVKMTRRANPVKAGDAKPIWNIAAIPQEYLKIKQAFPLPYIGKCQSKINYPIKVIK